MTISPLQKRKRTGLPEIVLVLGNIVLLVTIFALPGGVHEKSVSFNCRVMASFLLAGLTWSIFGWYLVADKHYRIGKKKKDKQLKSKAKGKSKASKAGSSVQSTNQSTTNVEPNAISTEVPTSQNVFVTLAMVAVIVALFLAFILSDHFKHVYVDQSSGPSLGQRFYEEQIVSTCQFSFSIGLIVEVALFGMIIILTAIRTGVSIFNFQNEKLNKLEILRFNFAMQSFAPLITIICGALLIIFVVPPSIFIVISIAIILFCLPTIIFLHLS